MMNRLLFPIVIVCMCLEGFCADDAQIGYALLHRGAADEASAYINRAWEQDSLNPMHRFLKARMLTDAQAAAKIYLTVAEDKTAADSLRAYSFFMLGAYCLSADDRGGARDYYNRSAKLNARFIKIDRLADDLLFLGQVETAASVCRLMLAQKDSIPAFVGLGNIAIHEKNFSEASEWFIKALVGAEGAARYRALIGAYKASCGAGAKKRSATYLERIQREFPEGMYSPRPCDDDSKTVTQSSQPSSVSQTHDIPGVYTLQVGAFGVKENALGLKEKLSESFPDIRIVAEKRGSVTLHKVWVGQFASEQQALGFGEENLRRKGIRFRVITQ